MIFTIKLLRDNFNYMTLNKKIDKICSNCVMDTTDSKIEFDEKGICDHCNNFYENILPLMDTENDSDSAIKSMENKIKEDGKDKDFDCIIGLSGGLDSSYLTHIAVKKMGLKPLVFHVDAGWNTQEAVNNIECLIEKLNLDLFTEVIDWEEMKDLQLAFFKSGVPHIDIPQDVAFFSMMYKFAEKYNIKNILTGANYSTECIRPPVEWMYYADKVQIRDIHNKFGTIKLNNFPFSHILKHKFYLPYIKGIQIIKPLNYFSYIKKDVESLLINEYSWQTYPQKHFESRFTRFYEGYWLLNKFGYDARKPQLSSLILTNQSSRDEALKVLEHPPISDDIVRKEFTYIATKLGVSEDDLKQLYNAPNKSYIDYKNQQKLYEMGSKILKTFGYEMDMRR